MEGNKFRYKGINNFFYYLLPFPIGIVNSNEPGRAWQNERYDWKTTYFYMEATKESRAGSQITGNQEKKITFTKLENTFSKSLSLKVNTTLNKAFIDPNIPNNLIEFTESTNEPDSKDKGTYNINENEITLKYQIPLIDLENKKMFGINYIEIDTKSYTINDLNNNVIELLKLNGKALKEYKENNPNLKIIKSQTSANVYALEGQDQSKSIELNVSDIIIGVDASKNLSLTSIINDPNIYLNNIYTYLNYKRNNNSYPKIIIEEDNNGGLIVKKKFNFYIRGIITNTQSIIPVDLIFINKKTI